MKFDLNDMYYFVHAVDHQGYTAAARALGVSKSLLSRRIAALENDLGARLVQRSTRSFTVTELGQQFAEQCRLALQQAQAAEDLIGNVLSYPRGKLRISAPEMVAEEFLSPIVSEFLVRYPEVAIEVLSLNREVDLIDEGLDISIQPSVLLQDSALHARQLVTDRHVLTCSPAWLARHGSPDDIRQLEGCPALLRRGIDERHQWVLFNKEKEKYILPLTPKLVTNNIRVLIYAAMAGVGIGFLPQGVCSSYLNSGELCHLLPEWSSETFALYAVYESRRGQTLLFKTFMEYLNHAFSALSYPPPPLVSLKPDFSFPQRDDDKTAV